MNRKSFLTRLIAIPAGLFAAAKTLSVPKEEKWMSFEDWKKSQALRAELESKAGKYYAGTDPYKPDAKAQVFTSENSLAHALLTKPEKIKPVIEHFARKHPMSLSSIMTENVEIQGLRIVKKAN